MTIQAFGTWTGLALVVGTGGIGSALAAAIRLRCRLTVVTAGDHRIRP